MEHELYMDKLSHIPLKLVEYGNSYTTSLSVYQTYLLQHIKIEANTKTMKADLIYMLIDYSLIIHVK